MLARVGGEVGVVGNIHDLVRGRGEVVGDVRTGSAVQQISYACTAIVTAQDVCAFTTEQRVRATIADQNIIGAAAFDGVSAAIADYVVDEVTADLSTLANVSPAASPEMPPVASVKRITPAAAFA